MRRNISTRFFDIQCNVLFLWQYYMEDPLLRGVTPTESDGLISTSDMEADIMKEEHFNQYKNVERESEEAEKQDMATKNNSWNNVNFEDENGIKKKETTTYTCPICQRMYTSKYSLMSHKNRIHKEKRLEKPEKKVKCPECGKAFASERLLSTHMFKHTGIICDICGKTFSQVGNLMIHKRRHTGIKPYKCTECEYSFYTDKELKAHMIRHTGFLNHICEVCGKRCRDAGVLTAHMRRHTGERPAKCEVCGKCFYSYHDLNVHAVAHSSERPFGCEICGNTFQRKKALRVHKKLHTRDPKHECKVCGKKFALASGLTSHMRSHDAALSKNIGTRSNITLIISNKNNKGKIEFNS